MHNRQACVACAGRFPYPFAFLTCKPFAEDNSPHEETGEEAVANDEDVVLRPLFENVSAALARAFRSSKFSSSEYRTPAGRT